MNRMFINDKFTQKIDLSFLTNLKEFEWIDEPLRHEEKNNPQFARSLILFENLPMNIEKLNFKYNRFIEDDHLFFLGKYMKLTYLNIEGTFCTSASFQFLPSSIFKSGSTFRFDLDQVVNKDDYKYFEPQK